MARLLHDVVEDTAARPQRGSEGIRAEVEALVDGVTKLTAFLFNG